MFQCQALNHFAEQLVAFIALPRTAFFIVVEVKTAAGGRQPELQQRRLTAEDQGFAILELDCQDAGGILYIYIQIRVIKDVFQILLGGIDQIVKTGFSQTHGGTS